MTCSSFADDIGLLALSKKAITSVIQYSLKWRIRFTAVKSTVLVFRKYHRNSKLLLEQEIQSVEEDGHLGVPLSPNKNGLKSFFINE